MMNAIQKFRLPVLALIILLGAFGCKSSKKAVEASNTTKDRTQIEQDALDKKRREEEEARWKAAEAKARVEAERMEAERKAAELKAKEESASETSRLKNYFETIAESSNTATANRNINEALDMFASPNTPVLIVISEERGIKDYDRPTTIEKYLNYLKDQKKNINTVSNLKVNASGKITEVELIKNL